MIDIEIGRTRIGLAAQEHAELYKCEIEKHLVKYPSIGFVKGITKYFPFSFLFSAG